MAWDSQRQRVLMFGGGNSSFAEAELWEWDGVSWTERHPAVSPSKRQNHAMAYDPVRHRLVLFGGQHRDFVTVGSPILFLGDTWEFDGLNWLQRSPVVSPSSRSGHQMAYDSTRQRVVLFGGSSGAETWEWDGTNWSQRAASGPPARAFHAMAYDSSRSRLVLMGGLSGGIVGDTWEWDGTAWLQRHPTTTPSPRWGAAMAFDPLRARIVMSGGRDGTSELGDTWEWDGTNWVDESGTGAGLQSRDRHAMAFDEARGRMVLFGGYHERIPATLADTWERNGVDWVQRLALPLGAGAIAFDQARSRIVLFGGFTVTDVNVAEPCSDATWEWDGQRWAQRFPVTSPVARRGSSLTYDSVRHRTVLFGGVDAANTPLADTWEWDGSEWVQSFPATSPSARRSQAAAFDEARGRVVLVGGWTLSDVWEWDGTNWLARPAPPEPLISASWDSVRQRTVATGANGTWEWDGSTWLARGASPGAPGDHVWGLGYDPIRRRTVASVFTTSLSPQTWEWDGNSWVRRSVAVGVAEPNGGSMAWDGVQQRLMMFDVDTWFFEP